MVERRGDQAARARNWLADLFREQRPRLLRGLGAKTRDPDDAADLLQDAFERLAAAPAATPRVPAAYVQRVLRNLVIDRARHERTCSLPMLSLEDVVLPAVPPEQEHAIAAADLMHQYRIAVAALSPRTREVFLLHRVDDLTYRQIATRLGISIATVEYHISRALAQLDETLER